MSKQNKFLPLDIFGLSFYCYEKKQELAQSKELLANVEEELAQSSALLDKANAEIKEQKQEV